MNEKVVLAFIPHDLQIPVAEPVEAGAFTG